MEINEDPTSVESDKGNAPSPRRPRKVLPAKKLSIQKQFDVLRTYAISSTHSRNPVGNNSVGEILGIHANTVSICNPFFVDVGLLSKQGYKFIPAEEVLEYAERVTWDDPDAGYKLAPIIKKSWFAEVLLPRVTLRPITEDQAISFFAEQSGASPEHRNQLGMLLDYLDISGLIVRENGGIKLGSMAQKPRELFEKYGKGEERPLDPTSDSNKEEYTKDNSLELSNKETFQIPIPGKESAQITVPKGLKDKDWEMLKVMIDAYISRLKEEDNSP